jgi:pimeloyl-ACP methyl ester carboxylesterase
VRKNLLGILLMVAASALFLIACTSSGSPTPIVSPNVSSSSPPASPSTSPSTSPVATHTASVTPEIKKVFVGDIEMTYRSYGQGDPLLLIMGYSGSQDLWDPTFLQILTEHYRVITFDNRGAGATTTGTNPFSIEQFADDTAGLLKALGISKAHILGFSMGTNIAQELVLRYPDTVNKLVLYAADPGGGSAIPPTSETIQKLTDTSGSPQEQGQRLIALLFPPDWMKGHSERIKEIFYRSMETVSPETVGRQAQAIAQWKGSMDRLDQIRCPTLLVTGMEDVIVPAGNSLLMVPKLPGAWLVQLQEVGHGVMYQEPERLARIVLLFLE